MPLLACDDSSAKESWVGDQYQQLLATLPDEEREGKGYAGRRSQTQTGKGTARSKTIQVTLFD